MAHEASEHSGSVQRILRSEDTRLGLFAGWFLALTVFPAGGFYLFTIASPASDANGIRHFYDLRVADINFGGIGALLGLAIGLAFALWLTFVYPRLKEKEDEWDSAHGELSHDDLDPGDAIKHA
jgi:hypothetical protein